MVRVAAQGQQGAMAMRPTSAVTGPIRGAPLQDEYKANGKGYRRAYRAKR